MALRSGDLAFIDETLIQIRQIFPETNQVLAYSILESRLVLVDLDKVSNRIEPERESEFAEYVLLVSDNGERTEPGKRVRVDDSRQIAFIRLKDGTVIEAPKARIVIDGSKMLTADIIIYMIATARLGFNVLDFLGKMARINRAYQQVIGSDSIWKFMLARDYNQFYLHYLDAETKELDSALKQVLDTFTGESKRRGKNYYKRLYEFLRKFRDGNIKTTEEKYEGEFQGVKHLKGLTKHLNAVFQCGNYVYVLMGKKMGQNTGNVLMQIPHSYDIFAMFAQASGPLPWEGIIYHDSTPVTLDTYDQNGIVLSRIGPDTNYLHLWYYSVSSQKIRYFFGQTIIPFNNQPFFHVSVLNKNSIACSIVNSHERLFETRIYSRFDLTLQGTFADVHVIRAKNMSTFLRD